MSRVASSLLLTVLPKCPVQGSQTHTVDFSKMSAVLCIGSPEGKIILFWRLNTKRPQSTKIQNRVRLPTTEVEEYRSNWPAYTPKEGEYFNLKLLAPGQKGRLRYLLDKVRGLLAE